jgi:Putative beta-barrel porin-2, OmpL-like. bbp2
MKEFQATNALNLQVRSGSRPFWTTALATAGLISLGSVALGDESPVSSLVSGTTIGGAVETSAQWKPSTGSTMATRFANTAPDHYNGFNLEYVELRLEKPLDDAQWSAGYKAEMWFGQDASWLPGSLGPNLAIKQAYVTLRAPVGNGLDFKIGQFDTIIGYETLSAYANPNFSRNLGNWLEPYSHTGILASYKVTDWLGLNGGVADGQYTVMNQKQPWAQVPYGFPGVPGPAAGSAPKGNGKLTYLGSVVLTAPESFGFLQGGTLTGSIVDGGQTFLPNSMNYYVGLTIPTPIKEVTLGASYDYVTSSYAANSYAQSVAGYISWQITEKLKFNTRVEYANAGRTPGGVWILPVLGEADGYVAGSPEKLFAVTGTLEYALWANVVTRLETIWDHNLIGTGVSGPFNGSNNAVLLLANIAYKF